MRYGRMKFIWVKYEKVQSMSINQHKVESIDCMARSKKTGHCLIEKLVLECFGLLYAVGFCFSSVGCGNKIIVLSFAIKPKPHQLH